MNNDKKVILGLLITSIILIATSFLTIGESSIYAYQGKEVFQTTEAYQNFKIEVGAEKVDIEEMEVLSSAPPIVVQFEVNAPKGLGFPYGQKDALPVGPRFGIILGSGIGLLMCALLWWGLSSRETEKEDE